MDYSKLNAYSLEQLKRINIELENVERLEHEQEFIKTGNFDFTAWYKTQNKVVADCSQCGKKKEVHRVHGKAAHISGKQRKVAIDMKYFFFCKSCSTILEI